MQHLGRWDLHRTLPDAAGPAPPIAESTDINSLAVFPRVAVAPDVNIEAGGFETCLVYWTATVGEAFETDTLTIEPLFFDGTNGRWVRQPRFTINPRVIAEMPTHKASLVRLRIHAVALNAAVRGVTLHSTGGLSARRP